MVLRFDGLVAQVIFAQFVFTRQKGGKIFNLCIYKVKGKRHT